MRGGIFWRGEQLNYGFCSQCNQLIINWQAITLTTCGQFPPPPPPFLNETLMWADDFLSVIDSDLFTLFGFVEGYLDSEAKYQNLLH